MTDDAKKLTQERGEVYGHPLDDFGRMKLAWDMVKGCPDAEVRHALYMICVKVNRLVQTPTHQDSIDDIKGYAETINMIHSERKSRENQREFRFDTNLLKNTVDVHLGEPEEICPHGQHNPRDCLVCNP